MMQTTLDVLRQDVRRANAKAAHELARFHEGWNPSNTDWLDATYKVDEATYNLNRHLVQVRRDRGIV